MNNILKSVFYFAYFGIDNDSDEVINDRRDYISNQMKYLANLCDKNNINTRFIIATIPERFYIDLVVIAKRYNFHIFSKYISNNNNFEFNGISACIEYANENPESLIYYCHSKGSVNHNELSMGIFKYHCKNNLDWDCNTLIIDNNKYKAGLFPSEHGWLWHNFFWVKASYLKNKELLSDQSRHYYEAFIGERENKQAHLNVISTLSSKVFEEQDQLTCSSFYEANAINKWGYLNREFVRLGKSPN